jgi:hypothetical protein
MLGLFLHLSLSLSPLSRSPLEGSRGAEGEQVFHIASLYVFLVGGFNPSEKYQSVGISIPNIWKNVPNHQQILYLIHIFLDPCFQNHQTNKTDLTTRKEMLVSSIPTILCPSLIHHGQQNQGNIF